LPGPSWLILPRAGGWSGARRRWWTLAPDSIGYFADRRYASDLTGTQAMAVFIAPAHAKLVPEDCTPLLSSEPQAAYAAVSARLHRPRRSPPGAPAIHPDAKIEAGVDIGPGVVIGPGAEIGSGTQIAANAVIGPGVAIGRECSVGAGAVVGFALIGDRVRILANAVIGEAGFGVAGSRAGAMDIPQLGRVIIQDDVSVGAASCIDRGAYGDTTIGEHTKIDNLVQIGHNVVLGRNCLLAAHTGISGSCVVGDGVLFGGRAGIADHITIGSRAIIAAAAGVMKDVPEGEMWVGTPARPIRRFMRETAWLARQAKGRERGDT
jgi:UDP-3-O-[3-hydroxymyristoyl] glucosamine N-acyltransferase